MHLTDVKTPMHHRQQLYKKGQAQQKRGTNQLLMLHEHMFPRPWSTYFELICGLGLEMSEPSILDKQST
jgi:hypothetical protein